MSNNPTQVPSYVISDEIDLFELFHLVIQQKKKLIGCMVLAMLAGIVYIIFTPNEYKVVSILRPASISELDALNHSGVYPLSADEALRKVGARLDSYDTRFDFFKANEPLFKALQRPGRSLVQAFEVFNKDFISLTVPDPKKNGFSNDIHLEMQYPEGVDGAAILNAFVDYAIGAEHNQVDVDLKVIINNRLSGLKTNIDAARLNYEIQKKQQIATLLEGDQVKRAQLEDELSGLRLQMKMERNNRLQQLAEAIVIAKKMGIKKTTSPFSMADSLHNDSNQIIRTEINNQSSPLYFLGTDALEAERATLEQRTNDDFTNDRVAKISKELQMLNVNREVETLRKRMDDENFVPDIDSFRAEEVRIGSLNIDVGHLNLVTIDRRAQEPFGPVKPKKLLIIAFSLLLGLILGVLVVLVQHAILTRRMVGVDLPA